MQHLKGLVYQRTAPLSVLKAAVADLKRLDKYHEERQGWFGYAALFAFLLSLGLLLLFIVGTEGRGAGVFVTSGILAVAGVVCLIVRAYYKAGNTEDRRYQLLGRLLELLGTDMGDDAQLRVRLDLSRPDARSKFVRKGSAGSWKVKFYRDDWLDLQGRLLDGTAFQVLCTELFQHRSRWATSSSGKLKHKTKTKSAAQFHVRLKPKAKRYKHLSTLGSKAMGAVQLSGGAEPKGIEVRDGLLALKTKLKRDWVVGPRGKHAPEHGGGRVIVRAGADSANEPIE